MLAPAADSGRACVRCGTQLSSAALVCPACTALVHRDRLLELARLAEEGAASGDRELARLHWEEALSLVPARTEQHRQISARLAALADPSSAPSTSTTPRGNLSRLGRIGAIGAAVALLVAGKFKLLLLGLTKLSTVTSMFGFIAVYWGLYGWPLAIGIAGGIYVHEMGHVAMLRRYGIRADAPLFIPGVGALVLLREHVTDPIKDARIGLAGPVWGLAAALAAAAIHLASRAPIWWAIAELTAFLNLFNLMPIWQLDGSRGFHALSRAERAAVVAVAMVALAFTGVPLLWLVGGVAAFRTVRGEQGQGHPATLATFAVLLLALSWLSRGVQ